MYWKSFMNKPNFSFATEDPFTLSCIERLKRHPKRIVFSEGEDLRILQVAEKMVELEIGLPILLGVKTKIKSIAEENGINLKFINITNPSRSSDRELFKKRLERIERFKGLTVQNANDLISSPHRYAAMMVQYGHADGMVAGNLTHPAGILRAVQQVVKPCSDIPHVFATTLMLGRHLPHFGRDGHLLLADTAINPEPSIEELAAITLSCADLAKRLFEVEKPRVALLSHSTKGSNPTPSSQRMAAATELAHTNAVKNRLEIEIDGEIQADVALDPLAAEKKVPHMDQKGPVDALVFPNLDAAHISSKLLQHASGAQAYGQFIMGLQRPVAQIPMTADTNMIFGTAVAIAIEAISANELALSRLNKAL